VESRGECLLTKKTKAHAGDRKESWGGGGKAGKVGSKKKAQKEGVLSKGIIKES